LFPIFLHQLKMLKIEYIRCVVFPFGCGLGDAVLESVGLPVKYKNKYVV